MKAQHSSFDAYIAVQELQDEASFNEQEVLHELKHYLPAQAPLKDFIHHCGWSCHHAHLCARISRSSR